MHFFTLITALVFVATVSAKNIQVIVGQGSQITYTPSSVTAGVGDVVSFVFSSKNHTVTQSTFASPCTNMTTPTVGIDSGFLPVTPNATMLPVWSFTVNNASTPLWFYCRQTGHCQKGMVFAVNPTANKTFAAFQANALASASSSSVASSATSSSTAVPSPSSKSGALILHGSFAGVFAVVGLFTGLLL